jgi:hypothetical protein
MSDTERIAALEAELAAVKRHIERVEREHVSLLESYAALAAGRERERHLLEQDYTLLGQAIDERITGLAQRIATDGCGDERVLGLLHAFARAIGEVTGEAMAERSHECETRIMDRVFSLFERLIGSPAPAGSMSPQE